MVAIKTHFGEGSKTGHVPALYLKMLGELVQGTERDAPS